MSILKIQTGANNPCLRRETEAIKNMTPEIKKIAKNMIRTLESKDGIGLAAPQINKSFKIIAVKQRPNTKAVVLINPQIKKHSLIKTAAQEGCLSLPGVFIKVKRYRAVTVQALDIDGNRLRFKTKGLFARVIQHEIDHLNGILITDYVK